MSFPRYPKYKPSGVEWLGEVPEGWGVMSIKHIVSTPITDGPHETPEFVDEGIPFVSAEAISSGNIDFSKIRGFITEADHRRYSKKYHPEKGDIFMIKSGATTGVAAIVETDIDFNIWSPLAVIRCGKQSIPRFVLNFMRSRSFQEAVALNWSFGTQQNIGMGVVGDIAITDPSIEEQSTIAAFLDRETARIDALVEKKTRFIELLKEKRSALITDAVTGKFDVTTGKPYPKYKDSGVEWIGEVPGHWKVIPIKRLSIVQRGASPRPIDDPTYFNDDGEFAWVRIADVSASSHGTLTSTTQTLSKLGSSLSVKIYPGELFLSIAGTVGKPCIADIKVCIHDGFVYFPTLNINPKFLYRIFETGMCYFGLGKMGTQLNLNTETVGGINIALPLSSDDIEEILTHIDRETTRIDELVEKTKRSINLLKERRSALITAAVTGKIDVREYI
jgi:Restriction endonuclease S subunits